MREIYEILTALEPAAAAELAKRASSGMDLSPLDRATERMSAALDANDLEAWAEADDAFHRALLRLHGNRRMAAFVLSLYDQAHRARMITLRLRERPTISTSEHRIIVELLHRGVFVDILGAYEPGVLLADFSFHERDWAGIGMGERKGLEAVV